VVIISFLTGLVSGLWFGMAALDHTLEPYEGLEPLAVLLATIERDYVEEVPADRLVEAAIGGVLDALDRHSFWLTPEEYAMVWDDTKGSYEGLGIEFRTVPDGVLVKEVYGPAARDGLRPGDVLLAADGTSLAGLVMYDIKHLLRGPRGTPAVLSVRREGWPESREITIVRDRITRHPVLSEKLEDGIAYVRIRRFQIGAHQDLARELEGLKPLKGLVLDLRDNPGGVADEAVAVTDLFLDDGLIVSTVGRRNGRVERTATKGGVDPNVAVVVLVNGKSASGSELVAGALQDTGRAQLVGTHTRGKGTTQVTYGNPDLSAFKLTVSRDYGPSGAPVAPDEGRKPDFVVEFPSPDPAAELVASITALDIPEEERSEMFALLEACKAPGKRAPLIPWNGTVAKRIEEDPQLAFALELLAQ